MKKIAFLSTVIAAVLLVGSPAAKAVNLQLSAVTPLDTYTFDLIGFNINVNTQAISGATYLTVGTATFGLTTTVTGPNGQLITMTSSESVGVTTTTDTFTISTPTNFLTDASLNGTLINGIQFEVGTSNSGSNSVSLLLPITSYTAAGTTTYGTSSTLTAPLTPTTLLAGNGGSYAFAEGVNSGSNTQAINAYGFRVFSYSISYPTIVPEPSTWVLLSLGMIVGATVIYRRRSVA